jgi:opacity protein-like surface antigen
MRRYLTPALIVTAALSQPLTAFAQEGNCPPGAWFCGDDAAPAPSVDVTVETDMAIRPPPMAETLPVPEEEEPPPVAHHRGRGSPPPVVVYQPGASASPRPQIIIIAPGGTHVVRKAPPPPVRRVYRRSTRVHTTVAPVRPAPRWKSEWGVNLRLQGVSFGGDGRNGDQQMASRDAGMGGFGMSLRYRPTPRFAFDAGFDILGGTDFNGFDRVETPFSVGGIFYFNPRSRSQFYITGGVNWSSATVTSQQSHPLLLASKSGDGFSADYTYFGGQLGAGLEFRLSKRLAFNVDVLGFVRSRTDIDKNGRHGKDKDSDKLPEFMDPDTGRTSNTSGGGLFRGGLTFWW